MSIDPKLIRAEAEQVQQIPLTEARAAEIAGDVDSMIAGLARVAETIGFFDEPDSLRAVLWELREGAQREREGPLPSANKPRSAKREGWSSEREGPLPSANKPRSAKREGWSSEREGPLPSANKPRSAKREG